MDIKAVIGAFALLVGAAGPALGQQAVNKNYNLYGEQPFAPAYERTSAPFGFVEFCKRHQSECVKVNSGVGAVELTSSRWQMMQEVNDYVNDRVAPVTDQDLYSTVEHWTYPGIAGDCEDYVLLKKRYLEGLGFPAETLLITVVLDEDRSGHAILLVKTDAGDYALDNRRRDIRRWSATGYRFLKRQSQDNPQVWVSMTKERQHSVRRHYGRS